MDAATLQTDLQLAFSALSILYTLGKDIEPALLALYQTIVLKKPLTADQRAALLANHQALSASLQQPIPDAPVDPQPAAAVS